MSGIAGIVGLGGSPINDDEAQALELGLARATGPRHALRSATSVVLAADGQASSDPSLAPAARRLVVALDRPHAQDPDEAAAAHERSAVDHLRREWSSRGVRVLTDLGPRFALALWDPDESVLWLARDALGHRPLFWTRSAGRAAFSSEVPNLLALPWVSRRLATEHLAELLSFRYVHAPRTPLKDLQSVPAGSWVRIDTHQARVERWWHPTFAPRGAPLPTEGEAAQVADDALGRAVRQAVHDQGEVTVLHSGGLDSSAILHHCRQLGHGARAVTVSLGGDPADEAGFAGRVAKLLGARHEVCRVESQQVIDGIDTCTTQLGMPLTTPAVVILGLLYRHVRTHAAVVLDGDGGDEVLGGRGMGEHALRLRQARLFGKVPSPVRTAIRVAARRVGRSEQAPSVARFGLDQGIGGSQVFDVGQRVALLRDPALVRPGLRTAVLEPFYAEVDTDPINAILHVWQRGWLAEDRLARSDRLSAPLGLELRHPMLDLDMLRACNALPGEAKVHTKRMGYATKWPLRVTMKRRLPARLIDRPQRGLPNPQDRWLREEGAHFLRERCEALSADPNSPFLPSRVRQLMTEHLEGKAHHGLALWSLLSFHAYVRAFQLTF